RPPPTSRQRRGSGPTGFSACGTTRRRRSTTRSVSARETRRRSATTTSGGCRKPTTPTAGAILRFGTSATVPCFARAPQEHRSATPPTGLPHSVRLFYLQRAAHWANAYMTVPNEATDTRNLYDVSGLAHFELDRAIANAGNPNGLETTRAALLADLKKQLDKALAQSATDPFQFGFPWAAYDTTSHGAGLSVMASEYDQLTGTSTYAVWSGRWLANILGANAWGTSLIVGDGSTFPHCMQHQVANLAGSLDGSPPILAGAAVEGPNAITARGIVSGMRLCPPDGSDPFAQ